jgi:predicted porin
MQKRIVAIAAIAMCGAASAQSSVTLFGVVDLGYQSVKTNAGRLSGITPSSNSSSRLGIRGVEDLGGGLAASFWLEGALNPSSGIGSSGTSSNNQAAGVGSGGLTFNRRSTVSLSGGFGELRLGRDYAPSYWNYGLYDPFGNNSVAASITVLPGAQSAATMVRVSNSISYFLPGNLGGIYGQAMYALGNRASNEVFSGVTPAYAIGQKTENNGRYFGLRLGYGSGPIDTAVSYGRTTYAPGTNTIAPLGISAIAGGNYTDVSWGGSYKLGPVKAMALVARNTVSDAGAVGNDLTARGWNVGADWGLGAGEVLVSYGRMAVSSALIASRPTTSLWGIGYVHNLSKRSAVYAYYSRVGNSGGAAQTAASLSSGGLGAAVSAANVNGSSTGMVVGLRHAF